MTIDALARLEHRSGQMTTKLAFGTRTEIAAARELLRQSLVELYELGHWLHHPTEMRKYMHLYRMCGPEYISAPRSMSAPDRRGQCSP